MGKRSCFLRFSLVQALTGAPEHEHLPEDLGKFKKGAAREIVIELSRVIITC